MDGELWDITLVKWDQGPFVEGKDIDAERPELSEAAYNTNGATAEPKSFGSDLLNGIGGDGDIRVPFTRYSPEKIFSGAVPAFDVNFIDPREWTDESGNLDDDKQNKSIANILHDTIAKWYVALRNLAIVGMLIILLYVGIRIIVSSTASDKAKYKEFLKNNQETYDFSLEDLGYETLPDGYYFVMGDNRTNSTDSRVIGLVSAEDIEGTTNFVIFPLNKFGNFNK